MTSHCPQANPKALGWPRESLHFGFIYWCYLTLSHLCPWRQPLQTSLHPNGVFCHHLLFFVSFFPRTSISSDLNTPTCTPVHMWRHSSDFSFPGSVVFLPLGSLGSLGLVTSPANWTESSPSLRAGSQSFWHLQIFVRSSDV